jgi:2,4-dienoyl-CoA reductase-like NADH-dependent reductase (Old Yellow Enzyme family)
MKQQLFTPSTIGTVSLRSRTIPSAAFENICYHNKPPQDLFNAHVSVAKGGSGNMPRRSIKDSERNSKIRKQITWSYRFILLNLMTMYQ